MSGNRTRDEITYQSRGHREPAGFWFYIVVAVSAIGLGLAVNQIFIVKPIFDNTYLYCLLAIFLSLVFIFFPASTKAVRNRVPWYDVLGFLLTMICAFYLASKGWEIQHGSYLFSGAPLHITIMSLVVCLAALEAARRIGGLPLLMIAAFFFIYPIFAYRMPGLFEATYFSPWLVVRYHMLTGDSIIGLPVRTVGTLVIGFMVFGVVLVGTGGGKFFLNLALSLFGTQRGGPAKVAILSSAFFGSLSGSVMSNVISTGSVTIPAMKRTGYPPHYAAAVEACASTGGVVMPPIMGATAFIMASFLGVPYLTIAIAAVIPSILYYLGLFVQVDAYAAKVGLQGLKKSDVPSILTVLKKGWPFIFAFVTLIYFLYLRRQSQAPFFAMLPLLAAGMASKETRLGPKDFLALFKDAGLLLTRIIGIVAGIGFIIGSLFLTGVGPSFSRELVALAGGQSFPVLLSGAVASLILGMGVPIAACYIVLAIVLSPSLVGLGFNVLAVHLFIFYWGAVSYITPPVALGAYTAAGIAGASPTKTGFQAMRLGAIIYFVPFFFIYSPSLILQGMSLQAVLPLLTCIIGIILLAGSMERFFVGCGKLSVVQACLGVASGLLLAAPNWQSDIIGLCVAGALVGPYVIRRKRR